MRQVVERTGALVLVTDRAEPPAEVARGLRVLHPGAPSRLDAPDVTVLPANLAYVMFTSGSTGEPKGIGVSHRDVLTLALDRIWHGTPDTRVLLHSPHAFDISTYELWSPLLTGGRVVVAPPGRLDPWELRRAITDGGVTSLLVAAGLFGAVADVAPDAFATVDRVLTGGDVVSPTAVRRVLEHCPGVEVVALYGPTEITLTCTSHAMRAVDEVPAAVPIGRPMDNRTCYVLDPWLNPVPDGVA